MTEQEVIDVIMQVSYDGEFPMNSNEAFGIACEALEKQIPKKPIMITNESHSDLKTFECPVCGNVFVKNGYYPDGLYSGHGLYSHKYCEKCGKHIDWSVEE